MAESDQTPKYSPDNKSSVYDEPGSAQSTPSSGLYHQEGSTGNGAPSTPDPLSSGSLKKAESSGGFYNKSTDLGAKVAGKAASVVGPEAVIAQKTIQRVIGLITRHKTGTAVGGSIVGFLILILILSSGFFIATELVTIEKVLVDFAFGIEEHFEESAGSSLMQKMICIKTQNCKPGVDPNDPADSDDASPTPEAGETLTTDMEDFPLTSAAVVDDLSKVGISETTTPTGSLELKNSDGQNVTDDIASNADNTGTSLETALPEWDVGQEEAFIPLMAEHAGATFDPITPENESDPDKAIEDDVLDGATESEIVSDASFDDNQQQPAQNAPTSDVNNYDTGQSDAGALSSELDATNKAIDAGDSEAAALAAGEAAESDLSDEVLASGIASQVCSLKTIVAADALTRVPKIITLLIRHGSVLISLADELKSGNLSGTVVNSVMKLYNGDPNAQPTTINGKTTPAESSLPFSSSAAWQSATGGKGGVAADSGSLPTANAGTDIYNDISHIAILSSVSGVLCTVEQSGFGVLANGLADGVELFTAEFGSVAATAAVGVAIQATIKEVVLPEVLKYFTPVGLDGLEDSVQETNNDSNGLAAGSADYSRSLGANPITTPTANQLSYDATAQQDVAESHLPLIDRTLALSNPESLASRIISKMPIGLAATVNGAISYLTSIPASIFNDLSSILAPRALAAATATNPGEAAGITEYAFTNSEYDKYDPIANEQYLFTPVTFRYKTIDDTIPNRITALGNPNTAIMNLSGDEVDSNNNLVTGDLLHCYLDSYTDLQVNTLSGTGGLIDTNCTDKGVFDLGDYDYNVNTPASTAEQTSAFDADIVNIYCTYMNVPLQDYSECISQVSGEVNDDIGHFRQYILDVHVMKDYESLTSNQ